ncbi:putative FAD-dependent oxygenase [Cladorrhinum sp. PSN259]|nr:putative FAD-dependent oxygenase [Cladorrhinum sp. PSN259]
MLNALWKRQSWRPGGFSLLFQSLSRRSPGHQVQIPPDILQTLPPLLSPSSQILLPSDPSPSFTSYATRWTGSEGAPHFLAVILPTTESDISAIVRYANAHSIPFLAISGQHGAWFPLSEFSGIAISLKNLSTRVKLVDGGKRAVIGGGASIQEVIHILWSLGRKQTVTGGCECVGAIAPGLGGGHGMLQGQYGLPGDQWVSARVVLGNGTVVSVDDQKNKDLWWGLRGAGHNFGIVSEVKVKVYEPEVTKIGWSWEGFVFKGDKIEVVYAWLNGLMDGNGKKKQRQPKELVVWSVWQVNKSVDPEKPVISLMFFFNGPAEELKKITKEVHNLGPATYNGGAVAEYPDLTTLMASRPQDPVCEKGNTNRALRAADLISYEIPAMRKAYDTFSRRITSEPAFNNSVVLLEQYSVQAVQAVPPENTAYAHRAQRLLLGPNLWWPKGNATLDKQAEDWTKDIWKALSGTAQKRSYVNYAQGDEDPKALYGYEPWRLQKLHALKKKYDPEGRFGYFGSVDGH